MPVITYAQSIEIIAVSPGESATYRGHSAPDSDVSIEVSGSINVGVSGGKYESTLTGISIPALDNRFRLSVSPVKSINVSGSGPMTFYLWTPAYSGSVSGNTGYFGSPVSIPSGKYNVKVWGTAADGASSVNMKVVATTTVHTDSSGNFQATLSSSGLPDGVYTVRQNGGEVARVYLGVNPPPTYTLNLKAGWNLVSIPLQPENGNINSIFSEEQRSNIDVIWKYEGGNWQYWTTEPGYSNQFNSLSPDRGYYFYCYNPVSVEIIGTSASPKSMGDLRQGWNLIGFPGNSGTGIGSLYPGAEVVWKIDGGNWQYWTTEPGYTNQFETLDQGLGYWVYKN